MRLRLAPLCPRCLPAPGSSFRERVAAAVAAVVEPEAALEAAAAVAVE